MSIRVILVGLAMLLTWIWQDSPALAAVTAPSTYRLDRILIQPKAGADKALLADFHARHQCSILHEFSRAGGAQVLSVPSGETVTNLIVQYQQSGLVAFAEPDYYVYAAAAPNDPKFTDGTLWWLNNYGQSGGTVGADIHATNAWDILTSASNIVVAVIDSGINYNHEDLAANMWTNPADGSHGWNAVATNNLPLDDGGHGSLVAGVLGAVGNNGKGVTGVAWQVQMMACKFLTAAGTGSDSDLATCLEFALTNGARIINASFSSPSYSQTVSNLIAATRDAGIIVVAAAGNGNPGVNIDASPTFPACYPFDNIVTVAYTTRNDTLGSLSNYGATNVALAAPGDQIYSTFYSGTSSYYPPFPSLNIAGTSFSAPCVSAACALLMAQYPNDTYHDTITRLLTSVDQLPALAGKCRTGGRLNLRKALRTVLVNAPTNSGGSFQARVSGGLNRTVTVLATTNLVNWSPVFTNTTSTNDAFLFSDNPATNFPGRFFRASSTP
jgi:subtilisin family serine protease